MKDNLTIWEFLKAVPAYAKKKIGAGRLKGMTDIKPQWRLQIMTEKFGAIGIGWYYTIVRTWTESYGTEISAHVQLNLFIKDGENWSAPIPGIGGSMLVSNEKVKHYEKSLYDTPFKSYHSDEAYKMATTDALSVAMKQLGVAADVYMGLSDSKYDKQTEVFNVNTNEPKATVKQKAEMKDFQKIFTEAGNAKAIDYISESLANPNLTEKQAETIISHSKKTIEANL